MLESPGTSFNRQFLQAFREANHGHDTATYSSWSQARGVLEQFNNAISQIFSKDKKEELKEKKEELKEKHWTASALKQRNAKTLDINKAIDFWKHAAFHTPSLSKHQIKKARKEIMRVRRLSH